MSIPRFFLLYFSIFYSFLNGIFCTFTLVIKRVHGDVSTIFARGIVSIEPSTAIDFISDKYFTVDVRKRIFTFSKITDQRTSKKSKKIVSQFFKLSVAKVDKAANTGVLPRLSDSISVLFKYKIIGECVRSSLCKPVVFRKVHVIFLLTSMPVFHIEIEKLYR